MSKATDEPSVRDPSDGEVAVRLEAELATMTEDRDALNALHDARDSAVTEAQSWIESVRLDVQACRDLHPATKDRWARLLLNATLTIAPPVRAKKEAPAAAA